MKITIPVLFALLTFLSCRTANHTKSASTAYQITQKIPLDGDGFWDYLTVEEATERLFVSHGTQVQVVDLKTGKLLGNIPDTKGVHGIAIATDLGKGFISCGRDTSVVVFDLATLAVTGKIAVTGLNPDAILYDASSKQVFTFNHTGKSATAINALTGKVVGTIPLEGEAEFAVTDGHGTIFVNIEDNSEIAVIDSRSLKVIRNWPLGTGEEPTGLAFDVKNSRLFAVCGNQKMVILDSKTGKMVQTLPIGEGSDGVVFDPGTGRIYSSNGEGNMTVMEEKTPDTYQVVATVPTQKGARTIALDPKTHHMYLPVADREEPVGDARPKIKPGTFVVLEVAEVR
jgi:DNA-binding beta-propeller fold protein YncE